MTIPTYTQPIKEQARKFVLERAVTALTTDRDSSVLVRRDEFEETLEYGIDLIERVFQLSHSFRADVLTHTREWFKFYYSVVGSKSPGDLRVLYLCGPEPQNDLRILLNLGVIPQNIWAIESGTPEYKAAVEHLKCDSHFIRIHHGTLETFFDFTNEVFDIIYIDACAALPGGRTNTLRSPLLMFLRERLAPISVLVTNFSQPPAEKQEEYERLFCYYFSSRYNDVPFVLHEAGADPALASGNPLYFQPYVREHFDEVYSDFITRFLVDLGREIVPYAQIYANPDVRTKYFASGEQFKKTIKKATNAPPAFDPEDTPSSYLAKYYAQTGDVILNTSGYPVLRFFRDAVQDTKLQTLIQPLLSHQLRGLPIETLFSNTTILSKVIEGHWDVASDDMKTALRQSWFDARGGLFCDVPLPNLIINSLFGIYGHPYLPNPRQSARFSYTAKSTKMYTDILVLDQCRYYFDYLPTIDLIPQRFQSVPYQLIMRTCLDRIGRHDFSSSSHPFRGAALGGFGEFTSARAYDFPERSDGPRAPNDYEPE